MFERFTRPARAVVTDAVAEAEQRRDRHVGTEHLLVGLARSDAPVVAATLREFGLHEGTVRAALADFDISALEAVGIDLDPALGTEQPLPPFRAARPWSRGHHRPFTQGAKDVLEASLQEAKSLRSRRLGAEHLLLALAGRSAPDPGIQLLHRLEVLPEQLRRATADRIRRAPAI